VQHHVDVPHRLLAQPGAGAPALVDPSAGPQILVQLLQPKACRLFQRDAADMLNIFYRFPQFGLALGLSPGQNIPVNQLSCFWITSSGVPAFPAAIAALTQAALSPGEVRPLMLFSYRLFSCQGTQRGFTLSSHFVFLCICTEDIDQSLLQRSHC